MNMTRTICWALACSILATVAPSAYADRNDRGRDRHDRGYDRHFSRGDHRVLHTHDWHRWRGGHWVHGHHGHRLGWWWVVGGLWYFYPRVIYPYPYIPPVVAVQPNQPAPAPGEAPPVQYWYYCEAAKDYYPYVPSCPAGWKMVPTTPSDVPVQ